MGGCAFPGMTGLSCKNNKSTMIKTTIRLLAALMLSVFPPPVTSYAQTDGAARMAVTINDYNGAGTEHWTVAWVTTESGVFIKTLWKQGTKYAFTSSQWTTHTPQWNSARGGTSGSTVVDGYTSATATSYTGTNSPVILTWNCRDTNNVLVADGNYKLWVQYAENSGAGPYTTNGLLWTKGPSGVTNNYPNLGANFTNMRVAWVPVATPPVPPTITSAAPPLTGTVGVPYSHTCVVTGAGPITFTAAGLPGGLSISAAGAISGIPLAAGNFSGAITASNGVLPNAVQAFSITIDQVPASINSILWNHGSNVVMSGAGPAGGFYTMLFSTNLAALTAQWQPLTTNIFDSAGNFRVTNTLPPVQTEGFYLLRVP